MTSIRRPKVNVRCSLAYPLRWIHLGSISKLGSLDGPMTRLSPWIRGLVKVIVEIQDERVGIDGARGSRASNTCL